MFTFVQKTGNLYHDGELVGTGYAGFGDGKNNPDKERVPNVGPIPEDVYTIGKPFRHKTAGNYTLRLTAVDGHPGDAETHRDGFLIHGDNKTSTASRGCIVLPLKVRQYIGKALLDGCSNVLHVVTDEMEVQSHESIT